MAEEGWTDGLERLDTKGTRARLAALIDKCKFVAPGLELLQGQGLRDQVAATENNLRKAAQAEIRRLSEKLTEYRSGPLPPLNPGATTYNAHEAAAARLAARKAAEAAAAAEPEPQATPPSPPATRPVLPQRPMRLPPMSPGRSS